MRSPKHTHLFLPAKRKNIYPCALYIVIIIVMLFLVYSFLLSSGALGDVPRSTDLLSKKSPFGYPHCLVPHRFLCWTTYSGEFYIVGGTAILALEYFGSWGHDGNSNNFWRAPRQLKIIKGHHGKLCIYSHLTSYSLDWIDEREEAGVVPPRVLLYVGYRGWICMLYNKLLEPISTYVTIGTPLIYIITCSEKFSVKLL